MTGEAGTPDPPDWPHLFLVGAEKCGTTSLHSYLDQHPEICMAAEKEPHYFTWTLARVRAGEQDPDEARDAYLALWSGCGDVAVRGEASTSYLWAADAAERIHATVPRARILVLLRDPVERAYSHYLMVVNAGNEDRPFRQAIEETLATDPDPRDGPRYLHSGRYTDQIARYLDRFGRDRVHVALLSDLSDRPTEVLAGIARFLGVDPAPMRTVEPEVHHPYRAPHNRLVHRIRTSDAVRSLARRVLPADVREWLGSEVLLTDADKPPMDPAARRRLEEIFRPEIERLEALLDRDLSALRASWGPA